MGCVCLIKWTGTVRLDDYLTVKALRRQIALADKRSCLDGKPFHKRNEELADGLCREVDELCATLRVFGLFNDSSNDLKKRVDVMRRIREELGDVFLYSLRVANALDVDVSRSVHEKIYAALKDDKVG